MWFIEDSRQQADKHQIKHDYWNLNGHKVLRCKLPFGDYAPPPRVAVDTKANMSEIATNIGNSADHKRFREELKLAQMYGCHLVVLVENDEGIRTLEDVRRWMNPRRFYSSKAIDGERLYKSMATMSERYGVEFRFCAPEDAGRIVVEILEGYEHGKDSK